MKTYKIDKTGLITLAKISCLEGIRTEQNLSDGGR